MGNNLPANAEDTGGMISIPGLGGSLRGENGNHSNILAWRIPRQRNLTGCSPQHSKILDIIQNYEHAHMHHFPITGHIYRQRLR